MSHSTWIAFLAVSLAAVLTPGPTMLAILGHALAAGSRRSMALAFGNVFGAVVLMGASVAGLSAVLAAVPHGLTAIKWAGGLYLFWLGLHAWRRGHQVAPPTEPARTGGVFARGLLIAVSNPKAMLFYAAVLPQFLDPARSIAVQFAIMAATFAGLELVANIGVIFAAEALSPVLRRAAVARRVHRVGGGVMMAAATFLALAPVRR
jgi:threonine/homoserine/homoserine lactone efflux protein